MMKAIEFHYLKIRDIITSEEVKSYKPRPEIFIEALKRSKLNVNEVIHISDSILSDVGGALSLGIKFIWLNRLNKSIPEGINLDYMCKDLTEARADFLCLRDVRR